MKALILHGFTGSLDTVKPLAEELERRGLEVSTPVLRGHGTQPEHLFRVHWRDWVSDARESMVRLAPKGNEPVVVAGLSMGALVACVIAAEFSVRVQRVALIAPAFRFRSRLIHAIPLLKRVWGSWAGNPEYADSSLLTADTNYPTFPIESFEQTLTLAKVSEDLLAQIRCPVGTFYAKKDPIIPPKVLKVIDRKLATGPAEKFVYKRSYHEMLCDVEGEQVCADVAGFLLARP